MSLPKEIRDQIRGVVEGELSDSPEDEEVQEETPEATEDEEEEASEEEAEEGSADVDSETDEDETPEAPEVQEDDVPTEFFGLDLSDIEPAKRKELIDRLKKDNDFTQKVLQENAELKKGEKPDANADETPTSGDDEEPAAPVSDEDLMRELGYDPEDPMYEVKADVALPLARHILTLTDAVQTLTQRTQVDDTVNYWYDRLDSLEREHDIELPVSREDVIDFALDNDIGTPEDAFYRLVFRVQREVGDEVTKARREALELKRKQSTRRPRSKPKTTPKGLDKGLKVRDAIERAAKLAEEETGISWEEAAGLAGLA